MNVTIITPTNSTMQTNIYNAIGEELDKQMLVALEEVNNPKVKNVLAYDYGK